jgi:hypothetical protein
VSNFGRGTKTLCEQCSIWLNRRVEHAGPGRRIPHCNVATFTWRYSLRVLRRAVKEPSEPFACKCKAETNPISPSMRPAARAWRQTKSKNHL